MSDNSDFDPASDLEVGAGSGLNPESRENRPKRETSTQTATLQELGHQMILITRFNLQNCYIQKCWGTLVILVNQFRSVRTQLTIYICIVLINHRLPIISHGPLHSHHKIVSISHKARAGIVEGQLATSSEASTTLRTGSVPSCTVMFYD